MMDTFFVWHVTVIIPHSPTELLLLGIKSNSKKKKKNVWSKVLDFLLGCVFSIQDVGASFEDLL